LEVERTNVGALIKRYTAVARDTLMMVLKRAEDARSMALQVIGRVHLCLGVPDSRASM
jgi:hypothetical protein